MDTAMTFMKKFDFFGEHFSMTINKEKRMHTYFGAIISLIFYLSWVLSSFWLILTFYDDSSISVQRRNIRLERAPKQTLNSDRLFVFFLLKNDLNFVKSTQTLKTIDFGFSKDLFKTFHLKTQNSVKAKPCKEMSWYKKLSESFLTHNEKVIFDVFAVCPDSEEEELYVDNDSFHDNSTQFSVNIKQFAGQGAIPLTGMTNPELWLMVIETDFDRTKQTSEPLLLVRNFHWKYFLQKGITKRATFNIERVQSETNSRSLFGEELYTQEGSKLFSESEFYNLGNHSQSSLLLQLTFRSTIEALKISRNYSPLFVLLSNIGGVLELLVFFFAMLHQPISHYMEMKMLLRFGIMGKSKKKNLLQNSGDPKDPESYEYHDLARLKLINRELLKPRTDEEKIRALFLKNAEALVLERCDIYKTIHHLSEIMFLKNTFFKPYHHKLAPVVGLTMLDFFESHQRKGEKDNMSVTEALKLLNSPEEPGSGPDELLEAAMTDLFREKVEKIEQHYDRQRSKLSSSSSLTKD